MTGMLKKIFFLIIWLLVVCLTLIFCFTLGIWQKWSIVNSLLIWFALILMLFFLSSVAPSLKTALRNNWGSIRCGKVKLSRRVYLLHYQWNVGVKIIKRARYKYNSLPWYLMTGPRCGKSSLLAGSGLPRFHTENDNTAVTSKKMLQWWFFRSICILEVSSNFLSSTTQLQLSWRKLVKWSRSLRSPSGIIVTISMYDLLFKELDDINLIIRQHRALIEPLLQKYGKKIPLYVIVTQCDHLPGFTLWQQQLSTEQRQQAMGYRWNTPVCVDVHNKDELQPLFKVLHQGISRVRTSMGRPCSLSSEEYILLLKLPDYFAKVESSLRYALVSLCQANIYFKSAPLASVWFCSTDSHPDKNIRRTSVFIQSILTQHLCNPERLHRRRNRVLCSIITLSIATWLIVSSMISGARLKIPIETLTPDEMITYISTYENNSIEYFFNLPFLPLINQQKMLIESRLFKVLGSPRNIRETFSAYEKIVQNAPPEAKREYILHLANAIIVWNRMRDGAAMDELQRSVPIINRLNHNFYSETFSFKSMLMLERYYMQRPQGELWRQEGKKLLLALVNHDPTLTWLQAPSVAFPSIQAGVFWPSFAEKLELSGLWSKKGNTSLETWMSQIERAVGSRLPVFQQLRQRLPLVRQQAWQQFLMDISTRLPIETPVMLSRSQLIDTEQNQSAAFRFISYSVEELSDIPNEWAKPWLQTLRYIQSMFMPEKATTLFNQVNSIDNYAQRQFLSWFQKGSIQSEPANLIPLESVALKWQSARNSAVNEALTSKNPMHLIRGLFTEFSDEQPMNPLVELFSLQAKMQKMMNADYNDSGSDAVWQLFNDDTRRLLGNALSRESCRLNEQWKSNVILPIRAAFEQYPYDEQQAITRQLVIDFLRKTAKDVLVTGVDGISLTSTHGMQFPFNNEFIQLLQTFSPVEIVDDFHQRVSTWEDSQRALLQEKTESLIREQLEHEKSIQVVSISTLPVTIPEGAQVIPTGTELTLNCEDGRQKLTSLNFDEKAQFVWRMGKCSHVRLAILFPNFSVSYELNEPGAWPHFVNQFSSGEALLDSKEFGKDSNTLNILGIKNILVRFNIDNAAALQEFWRTWVNRQKQIDDFKKQITALSGNSSLNISNLHPTKFIPVLPAEIAHCQ